MSITWVQVEVGFKRCQGGQRVMIGIQLSRRFGRGLHLRD